ncbi:MAG: PfkB family carbohydrate kinase [Gammaproteobacteria bacterium]|nr:PfkB family carbohydrate kinase [Gammaproteobacteria bacterium]
MKSNKLPDIRTINKVHVLVVGDAMLDRYWYGKVERISPEAPVPVLEVSKMEDRLGGCCNAAKNIVDFGAQATVLIPLGMDKTAAELENLLTCAQISVLKCEDKDFTSTLKLRMVGYRQQLLRADFESKPSEQLIHEQTKIFASIYKNFEVILFSDYGKGALVDVQSMIKMAGDSGRQILVDPKGSDFSKYYGATVITPNVSELRNVVGTWNSEGELDVLVQNLREQYQFTHLLLTRGEDGVKLYDDEGAMMIPSLARDVYDVTGAGDTVISILATLLATGMSVREAVWWANRAAGIVVGKFGTSTVSYYEIAQEE